MPSTGSFNIHIRAPSSILDSFQNVIYLVWNKFHATDATMKLGLFGGTFDPVHFGHLLLAEQCREQCGLDAVWFLPSGSPPHKRREIMSGKQRTEMLELAIAGHGAFSVDDRELLRDGTTYTVDTLTELHAELPDAELFFLIGGDSLHDLPTWREPQRILELATIVAVNRGDRPLPELDDVSERLNLAAIQIVTMPGCELSATDIRRHVAAGKSIRYMTPRAVEVYIQQHELYRTNHTRLAATRRLCGEERGVELSAHAALLSEDSESRLNESTRHHAAASHQPYAAGRRTRIGVAHADLAASRSARMTTSRRGASSEKVSTPARGRI